MSMTSCWTNDKVLRFIDAIHRNPELWDVDSILYKNRLTKRDSWEAVGAEFEITPKEAYKKFKSLRTYAKSEHKKVMKRHSECADGRSGWFAYEALQFVLYKDEVDYGDVPEVLIKTENSASKESVYGDDPLYSEQYDDLVWTARQKTPHTEKLRPKASREDMILEDVVLTAHEPKRKRKYPPAQERGIPQLGFETFENHRHRQQPKETNSSSAFGEHVANKLCKYDDYTRAQVEFKICKILYEADMSVLMPRSQKSPPRRSSVSSGVPSPPSAAEYSVTFSDYNPQNQKNPVKDLKQ